MLHVLTHSFPTRRSSDLLPLAGLILLFKPFLPMFRAEQVAVTIAPLLPLGVIVASLAFIRRRLIAPNAWAIAPALLMFAWSTLGMVAPLRIDHHGWQLASSDVSRVRNECGSTCKSW